MKKNKFLELLNNHKSKEKRLKLFLTPVFVGGLLFNILLVSHLNRSNFHIPNWVWIIYLICFFAFLFFAAFYQTKITNKSLKDLGLFCSGCSRIITVNDAENVIATDRCPGCGCEIIE